MTTNYHTPIPTNSPANATVFNAPLGQLDSAFTNLLTGSEDFSRISFNNATILTISSGSITPTLGLHIVAAQSGTADNLDTITAVNNSFLFLKADSGDTITLTSSGNLNADNAVLSGNGIFLLFCQNNQWSIVNTSAFDKFSNRLFVSGLEINTNTTTNQATIEPGSCVNDKGNHIINSTSSLVVDLDNTGALGLDNGSVAADTWYAIWICEGTSGVTAVASTSFNAPTLPTGYDTYKRRLTTIKTNSSAAVYDTFMARGQGNERKIYYRNTTKAAPFLLLNSANIGQTGSRTSIDFTGVCPFTSEVALCLIEIDTPGGTCDIFYSQFAAAGSDDQFLLSCTGTGQISNTVYELEITYGSTKTSYIFSSAAVDEDLSLFVLGYVDNSLAVLAYTP